MRCPYPILVKNNFGQVREVPCGQCSACRLNKAREWSCRIMNETVYHKNSVFLTLTYNDDSLPENGSISKRELQLFLKRFRKSLPSLIRYFASGEYGDKSKRPHYHLIVFGVGVDDEVFNNKRYVKSAHGYQCELDSWPYGMVFVGDVTYDSACYVAKYTLKKVRGKGAEEHYANLGIEPEFSLMSTHPGIGTQYMRDNRNRLCRRKCLIGKNGVKYGLPRYYKDKLFPAVERNLTGSKHVRDELERLKERAIAIGKNIFDLACEDKRARADVMNSLIRLKKNRYEN